MSVFSRTTALYVGNNSYSAAYVGAVKVWPPVPPPVSGDYLTFEILTGGTIQLSGDCVSAQTVQYRVNNGSWNNMRVYGATASDAITVNAGDIVEWKGTSLSYRGYGHITFVGTSYFNAIGNVLSLQYGDDASGRTNCVYFSRLFKGSRVVSANNLYLPPADGGYFGTPSAYQGMFSGCTSLVSAPALTSTELTEGCYAYMFAGCTSLMTAPVLPAENLINACYNYMFKGCSTLNYIKCLATNPNGNWYTMEWVNGVLYRGTFVKKAGVQWGTGSNDIPTGWTVIEEP